jgi:EAL domain-containing protein (putative c-di-GMP-specific phosphodiesterase class I)
MILVEEIFKISNEYNDITLSVNISSYSIRNSHFLNRVKKLLKTYDIKKDSIIFEISANNTLNDIVRLNENITILKSLGILIAIDGFGADNTSFKYIKNINFDVVKFDIDYAKRYNDIKHQEILKAFITIFKDLGIKTVIKFIEDEKSYEFFKNLGVDYIQGFIVGKPLKEI